MESKDIFENLSPLDHRYYLANRDLFDKLAQFISEKASIYYCLKAECALLKSHLRFQGMDAAKYDPLLDKLPSQIPAEEVYQEEEKTQHNIRALVNVLKKRVPEELNPFVHLGATSVDILDTARALQIKDLSLKVILPLLKEVELKLIEIAEKEAETVEVGRTHGQFAVPITFGFAMAEYIARLGKSILRIKELTKDLRGKLAGAVGAYNAMSMITSDPLAFEKQYLDFLGLKASEHSTQMVEPEHLLRLMLEYNVAFGIIANLADDLRHLQRSEISEIREYFSKTQVGSSTMPQKRNPWNSEHIKSLWKAFSPRIMTMYMDQISEHQRDLSNSASMRFIADYIAGFASALNRVKKVLSGLSVDQARMQKNIKEAGDMVLAEAVYILLAMAGEKEGHEIVRQLTLDCDKEGKTLVQAMQEKKEVWQKIESQLAKVSKIDAGDFFKDPAHYTGRAAQKALELCARYKGLLKEI